MAVGQQVAADTVEDLGNVAILPGLVNAHTHLEFSNLTKPLGKPGIGFTDWIRCIIEYRRLTDKKDTTAVSKGLRECTRYGVTTIGEIAQSDWPIHRFNNTRSMARHFWSSSLPRPIGLPLLLEIAEKYLECNMNVDASNFWQTGLQPACSLQRPFRFAAKNNCNFSPPADSSGNAPGRVARGDSVACRK